MQHLTNPFQGKSIRCYQGKFLQDSRVEVTNLKELKHSIENVTYLPSFYDNTALLADSLIKWTNQKIMAAIEVNSRLARIQINSVLNQIFIETGVS